MSLYPVGVVFSHWMHDYQQFRKGCNAALESNSNSCYLCADHRHSQAQKGSGTPRTALVKWTNCEEYCKYIQHFNFHFIFKEHVSVTFGDISWFNFLMCSDLERRGRAVASEVYPEDCGWHLQEAHIHLWICRGDRRSQCFWLWTPEMLWPCLATPLSRHSIQIENLLFPAMH